MADKYNDGYMTGKCSALELVQNGGIEALEADIKMRKAYPVPVDTTREKWENLSTL